jgi:hypothetical protein
MTLSAPTRCSALSDELDEPMDGTVDMRTRWLLVEDRSAWESHAVRDVLGAALEAEAKSRLVRPLLIRRRDAHGEPGSSRRVFLIDTVTRRMAVRQVSDIAELDVDTLDGPIRDFGEPVAGPMFLVCTNGRRDACCALRGRAVLAALADEHADAAWECTHLGGHRFAGNLVCLPDGLIYGRVMPHDASRLASAYVEGRLDPEYLRGRSMLSASVQVAEIALRRRLGLHGLRDVEVIEASEEETTASATLRTDDGVEHRLELRAERLTPARAISCRSDELEEPLHWRVVATS